jgi:DNA-directed RNA polymerase specialized sigma24 family protein
VKLEKRPEFLNPVSIRERGDQARARLELNGPDVYLVEGLEAHLNTIALEADKVLNRAGLDADQERSDEVLEVDRVLDCLATGNPRRARVVELRFFAGLSVEETASVLGIAPRSVKREWALARIWLHRQIGSDGV